MIHPTTFNPTWNRRCFLRAAGLTGLAPLVSPLAAAGVRAAAGTEDWSLEFARALEANPMLLGWHGVHADRLRCEARIEGRLPEELQGTFYRNGPAVFQRFGVRYRHWFEGDGMVHACRFDGRGVSHRARVLATPKLARETSAQRRLYSGFATPVDGGVHVRRPDDLNVANTSILDHHGELFALWEGGSASVLDRDTLAWQGFKVWGESLEGLPFTAHPKIESDRTLWAFGYSFSPTPALVLYHIAPDGTVRRAQRVDVGSLGMVHDFVVTARHLVIVIPPLVFEPRSDDELPLDAMAWRPALGSRVLVVDKDDFDARRWYQLPAGFGFHHGNGWEDADGTIRYDHCVASDPALMTESMRVVMRGEIRQSTPELYTRFTLHPDGRTKIDETGEESEFPRIAPAMTGRRNRYVYTVGAPPGESVGWRVRQVAKRDHEAGTLETFDYGPGFLAEEHVFVPRRIPRSEDDGWLVGACLDYGRGLTGLAVFDARRIADGPLARAWFDYPLPLALHGHFSPA